jgi:hypothetical protein
MLASVNRLHRFALFSRIGSVQRQLLGSVARKDPHRKGGNESPIFFDLGEEIGDAGEVQSLSHVVPHLAQGQGAICIWRPLKGRFSR